LDVLSWFSLDWLDVCCREFGTTAKPLRHSIVKGNSHECKNK
jgi:hypothetical protein